MTDDVWIAGLVTALALSLIPSSLAIAWRFASRAKRRPTFLVPTSLPVAPPFLAGREEELRFLTTHIENNARSILIKGEAGIGKSALALTVAHQVAARFTDGQLFTVLNPLRPPGLQIADALGDFVRGLQRGDESVPNSPATLLRRYVNLTRRRRVLVVVDDVPEGMDIHKLVPAGPNCLLIVTSRGEVSGVRFDTRIPLGPLPASDALKLLKDVLGEERTSDEDWTFLISECHSVPLALSLAASALATRTNWRIDEARRRLQEFARQRERRHAAASPYDAVYVFLTEEEKNALRSLAAIDTIEFQPWELAAAAGIDPERGNHLAVRLAGAGLLERRGSAISGLPYFRVVEPVLEYARRLAPLDDPQLRSRRSTQLAIARQERIDRDIIRQIRVDVYTQLQAGQLTSAINTAKDAAQIAADREKRVLKATAYAALSEIYTELGDMAEAEKIAGLAVECGDPGSTARALRCRGRNARRLQQFDQAAHHFDEALRNAAEAGEGYESVRIHTEYAVLEGLRHDLRAAREHLRAAAEQVEREAGASELRIRLAWARSNVETSAGHYGPAERALVEARKTERVGLLQNAWIDHALARNAYVAGNHRKATEHAQAGVSAFQAMHSRYGAALCRHLLGMAALGRNDPAEAAIWLQEAVAAFAVCGDAWVEADASLELARIYRRIGHEQEAPRLVAAAKDAFQRLGDTEGMRRAAAEEMEVAAALARGRRRRALVSNGPAPAT
ncbi:hypothetical protein HCN51_31470 [Nonomuraea sp. FMUSA5-5]|uniref:AAA+ ATPase domain-containing protein n=1 Tax=Nonomuraea composti TaxID=2720023 RepID=A0ABX1BBL0_9ACTN|nr:AAA family ATPase [Nonomuraea sp. FMUSA5-5]NJP93907.1 hypothetical protein [Nonomuraea sp. FMUSA5-5]